MSPSVDYVVGSRQALTCRFNPVVPRPPDVYVGAIKTAGLDIGVKTGGAMLRRSEWRRRDRVGFGANVLVGGSRRSIALQPLSVEGNVGVDVSLGVSRLWLRAAS